MGSTEQKFQQFENEISRRKGGSLRPVPLWVRTAASLALLVVGILLYRLPGEFPPPAWTELYRLVRGDALFPLLVHLAVIVQSLALLVAWLLLLHVALRVIQLWRSDPRRQLRQSPLVLASPPEGSARGQTRGDARSRSEGERAPALAAQETTSVLPLQVSRASSSDGLGRVPKIGLLKDTAPTAYLFTLVFDSSLHSPRRPALPALYAGPGDPSVFGVQAWAKGVGLAVGSCCHPGSGRNGAGLEDTLLVASGLRLGPAALPWLLPLGLFVVADGFTFREERQPCSSGRLAVASTGEVLLPALLSPVPLEPDELEQLVLESVQRANTRLYSRFSTGQPHEGGAGTTLTTALVVGTTVYIANVGDSRAYIYRTGEGLMQVTYDHASVEGEGNGAYAQGERTSPSRDGQLYRSLGARPEIEADLYAMQLEVGDILLLCSNGLWRCVDPLLLEQTVQWFAKVPVADPFRLCSILREAALEAGGVDHLSVVAVQVTSLTPEQDQEADAGMQGTPLLLGTEV